MANVQQLTGQQIRKYVVVAQRKEHFIYQNMNLSDNAVLRMIIKWFFYLKFYLELLVGASCNEDQDCIENARCNKYCSCREIDLFFETENYFCGN